MATKYTNLTGHDINLNDGRVFPREDKPKVIVNEKYIPTGDGNYTVDDNQVEVLNLPPMAKDVYIIVPRKVFDVLPNRKDVIAPASGASDCIRWKVGDKLEDGTVLDDKSRWIGQVRSIPGFIVHK